MSDSNFNLRSWATKIQRLQAIARNNHVSDENRVVNVLGLYWDIYEDKICFIPKPLSNQLSLNETLCKISQECMTHLESSLPLQSKQNF